MQLTNFYFELFRSQKPVESWRSSLCHCFWHLNSRALLFYPSSSPSWLSCHSKLSKSVSSHFSSLDLHSWRICSQRNKKKSPQLTSQPTHSPKDSTLKSSLTGTEMELLPATWPTTAIKHQTTKLYLKTFKLWLRRLINLFYLLNTK